MRYDRLWAAGITVRRHGLWRHGEGIARACDLSGCVGDARFGSARVHMLVKKRRTLCHAGHSQEWRDECCCEDVFDGHDFSPAFDREGLMSALND